MFISIPIEEFEPSRILFGDKVANLIMENSLFVKILYSTPYFSTNGIFIQLTMHNIEVKKFQDGSLTKLIFTDTTYLKQLERIEHEILRQYQEMFKEKRKLLQSPETYKEIDKVPNYKLKQHLERRSIKLPNEYKEGFYDKMMILVKLSGVWVNHTEYGITYKFIPVNSFT